MKKFFIVALLLLSGTCLTFAAEQAYEPSTEAKLQYNQGVDYYKVGQYDKAMACNTMALDTYCCHGSLSWRLSGRQ